MQFLFSFDQDTRVEKTFMQTLTSHQFPCHSFSRLTGVKNLSFSVEVPTMKRDFTVIYAEKKKWYKFCKYTLLGGGGGFAPPVYMLKRPLHVKYQSV